MGEIIQHRSANSFRGAERRSGVGRDRVMKSGEPPGQGIHVPVFQPAGGQHLVQQRFLGKRRMRTAYSMISRVAPRTG